MRNIYFFKAKSRIGLKNKPIHQKELNLGVEDGPEAILTPDFLTNFPGCSVDEFEFPKPEDITEDFYKVLAKSMQDFAQSLDSRFRENDNTQIVIGGDHSVTLASILADLKRFDPKKIGVLHIDSHGDINLASESPTDNFHGMYLRPLFDKFDIPEIEALVPKKIPLGNLMIIGNLDLDPGEKRFLKKQKKSLKVWAAQFKHLHVSFDIDSMDKTIAPATGIPAEHGLLWKDLAPILKLIRQHPSFSFDLCEVNPKKNGGEKTVKLAQKILKLVLLKKSNIN